jgi:hypothetical protein
MFAVGLTLLVVLDVGLTLTVLTLPVVLAAGHTLTVLTLNPHQNDQG